MLRYMKENKGLSVGYLLLVPVAGLCSSLFAVSLEPLINVVYTKEQDEFIKFALLAAVCSLLDMGSHYLLKISREKLRIYYVAGLRRDLFLGILNRDVHDFQTASVAEYLSVMNRDVEKMNTHHFDSVCGFYRVCVNFMISLVLVLRISPWIAILNITMSLVSAVIPRLFEETLQSRQEIASQSAAKYQSLLGDYLNGFTTIKLFHIQKMIKTRLENANRQLEYGNYCSTVANYTAGWVSMFCSQFSFVATTALGVYFCLKGWMSVGQVVAISQLIGGIVVPFEELPEYLANYKSVKGIREKLERIMDCQSAKIACEMRKPEAVKSHVIQLQNVQFSYEEDGPQIQDLSLELHSGKKYVMVGASGSGKSTLAKLLVGFYPCKAGQITLDGKPIAEYREEQFYEMVTYLEQRVFLFDDSFRHNLTLYREYSAEEVDRALEVAGLRDFVGKQPDGLDTMIEGNGRNISDGERQRLGIARAVLAGANFLILDEATANLDPILAAGVEKDILKESDLGVLLITHKWSESLLRNCDGIFVMCDGRLAEQGNFDSLMARQGYFYSYYLGVN